MNLLKGLFRSRDKPQNHIGTYSFFFGGTASGKTVNERTAMQTTAVYACVRILAETIASLPLNVYRTTDLGKEKAIDRPEFQRMIADCKDGRIDLVITKSISRFARNTVTLLETVRELKMLGVDVYFEEQNIHSMSGDGELMLTILASYAQEESRSVSENCKWRIRKQFQQGEIVNLRFMYGYRINNGQIEIDQEQAQIVRLIYTDYLNGLGCDRIAARLRKMGEKTYHDKEWTAKRVLAILNNEKYAGNALLQKKYVTDHLSKKLVYNRGSLPKYYAEGTHEPIIDPLTFQKAQEIMAKRRENRNVRQNPANRYPFSGLIFCPRCGKNYRRVTYKGHAGWNCSTYIHCVREPARLSKSRNQSYCR